MVKGAQSMTALVVAAGLAAGGSASKLTAGGHELIKGISWGPVPLLSVEGASALPQDDWMAAEAVPMWGKAGRADLRVMKAMGANLVRLYGNNPANDHTAFLDAAHAEGLAVAPGMSDYPYYQMVPGRCIDQDFYCYDNVKPLYAQNLRNGWLTPDRHYHPALKIMNILNEPDLKMPPTATNGGKEGPIQMARTLISAFDAMLDAEREASVVGPLINFTATFSYAICAACEKFQTNPALGQMWQLHDAMHNPQKYGYTPMNDITDAYNKRWTHSFNTQNPASDLQHQFLDDYEATFPSTPIYIGEYHRVRANQTEDLSMILGLAEHSPLFFGISFFQYQVAYWKTGSEMEFGMFELGDYIIEEMPYFGKTYDVRCVVPQTNPITQTKIPLEVQHVYGGPGLDETVLCLPNPWGVDLTAKGYLEIASQQHTNQMSDFVENLVQHVGAVVTDYDGLRRYTEDLNLENVNLLWETVASHVAFGPEWVDVDPQAKCVANRNTMPSVVVKAIEWVCSQVTSFSCEEVPTHCASVYNTADYIFSRYYEELGKDADPLASCNFDHAGMYASSRLYRQRTGAEFCVKDAATGPLPEPIPVPERRPSTTGASSTPAPSRPTTSRLKPAHDIAPNETTTTIVATTTPETEDLSLAASRTSMHGLLALAVFVGLLRA